MKKMLTLMVLMMMGEITVQDRIPIIYLSERGAGGFGECDPFVDCPVRMNSSHPTPTMPERDESFKLALICGALTCGVGALYLVNKGNRRRLIER